LKIIKKYLIKDQSDLIFTRTDIKNFFKEKNFLYIDFFLLAVMELGTNILKYPKSGEIWLLQEENDFLLAALDKGSGIENIEFSKKKGYSTSNTLGLGLYQLSQHNYYVLEIFSSNKNPHGTVVLLRPKHMTKLVFLTQNYIDLPKSGDFLFKKGKFIIIGDVSGHGIKAYKSAEFIKNYFYNARFSCLLIDEFFLDLHKQLKENKLRSTVLSVVEVDKKGVIICGVGNINIYLKKNKDIELLTQKEGIVGENYSSVSHYQLTDFDEIFLFSDGINKKILYNVLKQVDCMYLSLICGIYFSDIKDDKTILGVKNGL